MSSFIESYTEPNTWKRSNIALIKAIIDEKKSLSSRLVTLKTVTDSLNEPVLYADQKEMIDGQFLHLGLWNFLLSINKNDLESQQINMIHNSFIDLIDLPEFYLTNNGIKSSTFDYNYSSSKHINLKEYKMLVWKTVQYSTSLLKSVFISYDNKKFISKILGRAIPMFSNLEEVYIKVLYSFSIPLNTFFKKFYPNLEYDSEIHDKFTTAFNEDVFACLFPSYIKVRQSVESIFQILFSEISFTYRKEYFEDNSSNIFGWNNFPVDYSLELEESEKLINFLIKDEHLIFNITSSLLNRVQRLFGEDLLPAELYSPFFIIIRSAMPIIQASPKITSRFSTSAKYFSSLPTDWHQASQELSKYFLFCPYSINIFLRIVFQPCNVYNSSDVNIMLNFLSFWFNCYKQMKYSDPFDNTISNPSVLLQLLSNPDNKFPFRKIKAHPFCFNKKNLVSWLLENKYALDEEEATTYFDIFLTHPIVKKITNGDGYYMISQRYVLNNGFSKTLDDKYGLPMEFDYKYFSSVLELIYKADNYQTLLLMNSLLYNNFSIFKGSKRYSFILDAIIGNLFNTLFFHWNHEVRTSYFCILIYKVYEGPKCRLPSYKPDYFLKLANLEQIPKFELYPAASVLSSLFGALKTQITKITKTAPSESEVFERALESEEDANDMRLSSKIDSYIQDVCRSINEKSNATIPYEKYKYAEAGIRDYVDCLREYYRKVSEDGIDYMEIPMIGYTFTNYPTIYQ